MLGFKALPYFPLVFTFTLDFGDEVSLPHYHAFVHTFISFKIAPRYSLAPVHFTPFNQLAVHNFLISTNSYRFSSKPFPVYQVLVRGNGRTHTEAIAQLVEHTAHNGQVGGSNPPCLSLPGLFLIETTAVGLEWGEF